MLGVDGEPETASEVQLLRPFSLSYGAASCGRVPAILVASSNEKTAAQH
jgi:hypothetical protein